MTKRRRFALGVVAIATLLATACKDDDAGSAPKISGLELSPTSVMVGASSNVTASFTFSDADKDASEVEVILSLGGQSLTLSTEIMGAEGQAQGSASVLIVVQAAAAGEIGVALTVIDTEGNRSNELTGTLDAVAMQACNADCDLELPLRAWLADE